jgi:sugar phosphate isomerase/epimerase
MTQPPAVTVPSAQVALSTASVYPESTATAFELAARLGYDGVEVMVWTDPVSQDVNALRKLSDYHGVPILALHAPCLVITQRVWGTDPWAKLVRAKEAAEVCGAQTVVVHPPFRWQREYARQFLGGIQQMADETEVRFAVENMFPLRARGREVTPYAPDWDPTTEDFPDFTLDLSHTSVSQSDALEMAATMGERLTHVHIADGTGAAPRRAPRPGPRQPAVRRVPRGPGPALVRRPGRRRGEHAQVRGPGRARGRPRRGARLHPAQPRGTGRRRHHRLPAGTAGHVRRAPDEQG